MSSKDKTLTELIRILSKFGFVEVKDLSTLKGKKGTYVLLIQLREDRNIRVGALGVISFKAGYYAYVGSAFYTNGLYRRILRHLSSKKKIKWHIDYLLQHAKVEKIFVAIDNRLECTVARALIENGFEFIPRFGSSDCKCPSHLFYLHEN